MEVNTLRVLKRGLGLLLAGVLVVAVAHNVPQHFGATIERSKLIEVEREWLFPEFNIQAHAVVQTADGHIVIAGGGQVSVVALKSDGNLLWKYEETSNGHEPPNLEGIVPLSNGNLLFCGDRYPLIRLLSSEGTLISESVIRPKDNSLSRYSTGFWKCIPSDGGALLFGSVSNPSSTATSLKPSFRWIVKVDQEGRKEWETVGDGTDNMKPPFDSPAPRGSGATFYRDEPIQNGGSVLGVLHFTRVSPQGNVIATRNIECNFFLFEFHMIRPTDDTSFLCAPTGSRMQLFRINDRLKDIVPPSDLEDILRGNFNAQLGIEYMLDDGSMLVFGRVSTQTGDQATMQLFGSSGRSLGFYIYDMKYPSFTVDQVFPLSGRRFLTFRLSNSPNSEQRGTVISWVNVK
jgi:hypothetical protein